MHSYVPQDYEGPRFPSGAPTFRPHAKPYKAALNVQVEAEIALDEHNVPLALRLYHKCPASAKIVFNTAQLHICMLSFELAHDQLQDAIRRDPWFTVAYFQLGAVFFRLRNYAAALYAYSQTLNCLRKGFMVEYGQLGLPYTVRVQDVLWNRGACRMAITHGASGLQVSQVPVGAVFRVPERIARARNKEAGEGTDWKFLGRGRQIN